MGRWGQREVHMYEKKVIEPRLTAGWDTDVDGAEMPAALRAISASLSDRYGVTFDRIWVNLYRDGRDSVLARRPQSAPTRTRWWERCRSAVGGGSCSDHAEGRLPMSSRLGHGDLVVMGGPASTIGSTRCPRRPVPAARESV